MITLFVLFTVNQTNMWSQNESVYIDALKRHAIANDAEAQLELGDCYYNGRGVNQDYTEAVKWYQTAAEQGHAKAQFYLGVCYDNGEGVRQDYEEAVKWYRKAAEQGDASDQYNLGVCYEQGLGIPQSRNDAIKWYKKVAKQGVEEAKIHLDEFGVNY